MCAAAEFDRWLVEHDRIIRFGTWDAAYTTGFQDGWDDTTEHSPNPYAKEER
jgi:hypothetical protein